MNRQVLALPRDATHSFVVDQPLQGLLHMHADHSAATAANKRDGALTNVHVTTTARQAALKQSLDETSKQAAMQAQQLSDAAVDRADLRAKIVVQQAELQSKTACIAELTAARVRQLCLRSDLALEIVIRGTDSNQDSVLQNCRHLSSSLNLEDAINMRCPQLAFDVHRLHRYDCQTTHRTGSSLPDANM